MPCHEMATFTFKLKITTRAKIYSFTITTHTHTPDWILHSFWHYLTILQAYDKWQAKDITNTTNSTRCSHEMVSIFSKCSHTRIISETLLQLPPKLLKVRDEEVMEKFVIACKENLAKQVGSNSFPFIVLIMTSIPRGQWKIVSALFFNLMIFLSKVWFEFSHPRIILRSAVFSFVCVPVLPPSVSFTAG